MDGPDRPQTPAELSAAGICWNARWRGRGAAPAPILERVDELWHSPLTTCRWCDTELTVLLDLIRDGLSRVSAEQEESFRRMGAAQRMRKVREAQEEPWWREAGRM